MLLQAVCPCQRSLEEMENRQDREDECDKELKWTRKGRDKGGRLSFKRC